MATIFIEGFDKYGPIGERTPNFADLLVQGEWTSYGATGPAVVAGLSNTGRAFSFGGGAESWVSKTLPTNYATLIGGVRFKWDSTGAGFGPLFVFKDITNAQCSVRLLENGTIGFNVGGYRDTQIQASTTSISQGTSHYLEFQVSFGSSASYQLWLDGLSIMSGTANTITNAHSYANVFMIGNDSGLIFTDNMILDDLYLFDTTGSTCNAPLLTNPRIETRFPSADVQTQFHNAATTLGTVYSITSGSGGPGANGIGLRKFTSTINQTLESLSCVPTQTLGAAKYSAVVYSDVSGTPTTRLSAGVETVGSTAFVTLTSALVTPVSLVAGTPYWIGFITDTSGFLQCTDLLTTGVTASATYNPTAPTPCPTVTTSQPNFNFWGNCVGGATNWEAVAEIPSDGDLSAITSSTVGNEDLYSFPALTASDAVIYTVAVKANFKRSDTGPRTVDLRLKSSGTDSAGTNAGLTAGTDYGWKSTMFDVDPHTSTNWTLAAANAAQAGPKVAS